MKRHVNKKKANIKVGNANGSNGQPARRRSTTISARGLGDAKWSEKAEVTSLSATGAGFTIERKCGVGNLVLVKVPLERHLRSFGHEEEIYNVWGLVQYCHRSNQAKRTRYYVGVAFVGQDAPKSYERNPFQHYRIKGMNASGLWEITEVESFQVRREMRYRRKIEMYLSRVDEKMRSIGGRRTMTENISRSGAAVVTDLGLEVGDHVKFICERYDFSSLAVVCGRTETDGSNYRLHLKFVGANFPVEKFRSADVGLEPSRI